MRAVLTGFRLSMSNKTDTIRNILILYGFVALLWLIHSTFDYTYHALPKQSFWQFFIYVDYARAFFYLVLVPLYALFEPQEPVHQWLLRILVALLIQYQLDAISAFGTLYHSSCAPAVWRTFALILNSFTDPAYYCWILLVAHGWGTNLHTDLYYLSQWPIVLYGIFQFARRLTDPVVAFEVRHLQCRLHDDWDKPEGVQDELELDSLGSMERKMQYLDLVVTLGYWTFCLYATIQTIQQLTEEHQRRKYQRFLYVLVVFASVELFAYFIQVLASMDLLSYGFFFTSLQLVQCCYMVLVASVAYVWLPTDNESQYNPLVLEEEPLQSHHYMRIGIETD